MQPLHNVYLLSFSNGKKYVGVTGNLEKRLGEHRSHDRAVGRAMRKHSFHCEILATGTRAQCFVKEVELIAGLNTMAPNGYNLTPGGDGVPLTPEVREKLRVKALSQWCDPHGRAKQVEAAKKRFANPDELEAHRKRCRTPEERALRSARTKAHWERRRAL